MRPEDIKIGTSGWKFDDWRGTFYPLRVPQTRWLEYYAARFPVGEINSTYYRIPPVRAFRAIDQRTPETFQLFAKVHRDVTHARTKVEDSMRVLWESLAPLRESGKLIGLLAQFPASFHCCMENIGFLEAVRNLCGDTRLCAEFRHTSWDRPEIAEGIRERGITWVSVDEPTIGGLMSRQIRVTSDMLYLRLHGRNSAAWYDRKAGDRYDYHYSPEEMAEWGERLLALDTPTNRGFVLFNNCYHGQAPQNAKWLMQWLEESGE